MNTNVSVVLLRNLQQMLTLWEDLSGIKRYRVLAFAATEVRFTAFNGHSRWLMKLFVQMSLSVLIKLALVIIIRSLRTHFIGLKPDMV